MYHTARLQGLATGEGGGGKMGRTGGRGLGGRRIGALLSTNSSERGKKTKGEGSKGEELLVDSGVG